ncbi:FscB [Sediminimonas sp.]|uniref:FscB n=1 Tax=Sediminimonas sp. TaxID=2823379 RepID=UPI0025EF11F9|nr:FscB [Sediminimonas sp.]
MRYTQEAAVDGEQFLKVETEDARLASRHATARQITPLLTEAALFMSARDTTWSIPASDLWFQVRLRSPNTSSTGFDAANTPFLSFFDGDQAMLARLRGQTDGSIEAVAEGDSQVVGATSFAMGDATIHWIDVKLSVGADIAIALHVDGVLHSSATAANTGARGKPALAVFANRDMHRYYNNTDWFYAHLAACDGVSTIGRRFARQTPGVVGTHDQWAGTLAALGDGNIVTRMTSDAAGQRQSATLAGPAGPAGAAIAGLHLKAIAQAGTSGPGSLAGSLRLGGVDHDAAALAVAVDKPETAIFSWDQNPGTGAAWSETALPDEIGVLSAP